MNSGSTCPETSPSARIIDSIIHAESLLNDAGVTDTPRLDAEVLLADTLGIDRSKLVASYPGRLKQDAYEEYLARLHRRAAGEPVAYITGKKEFMGVLFRIDSRALIPRPETEALVEHVVAMVRAGECRGGNIVDVGTGCGCIAVSLALLLPQASIHATDISSDCIELARENAERHGVFDRMTYHTGSILSALPESLKGSIDIIVSNPPYVSDEEYRVADRGVTEFEPSVALRGGSDGLDVYRRIAVEAADYLAPDGVVALEIGAGQAEPAREILEGGGVFVAMEILRDLADRQRVITARRRTWVKNRRLR